jgi:cell division septation protein DedD
MKDDQASEEKLMGELDRMYRHVADVESCQAGVEHNHNPHEHEQISDQEASTHAKIIPFPGHRIHLPSGEPSDVSEEEPKRKRKPSYRPYLIVASFSSIFLVFVFVVIPLKGMIAPPVSERLDPHQLTFPIHSTPSPPVQTEEDGLQNIEERQPKIETMPHQTFESNSPFTQERHYAVQVGAFRNWQNASQRIDALRKEDLEPYWVEIQSKSRRITYIVFSGYFTDRSEAAEFLKRKGILNNYPDSYVREISLQEK